MEILELKCKISELKNILDVFIANWTMQGKKLVKLKKWQYKLFKLIRENGGGKK